MFAAPAAAPNTVHFRVDFRAFIPGETAQVGGVEFRGDHRGFDAVDCQNGPRHPGASSRVEVDVTVTSVPRQKPDIQVVTKTAGSYVKVGDAYKYIGKASGSSVEARVYPRPDGSFTLVVKGNEGIGGLPGTQLFGISFNISAAIDPSGRLSQLVLTHDGYPSLELFWKLNGDCWKSFRYDSRTGSPWSLVGPETHVEEIIAPANQ
jgi:hypothetical protein